MDKLFGGRSGRGDMSMLGRLWARRRDRPAFVAVSVGTLLVLFVYPAVDAYVRSLGVAQPWNYQDFGVYRAAVERWVAGDPIYVTNESGGYWGGYLYPPVFLVLFRPFTALTHAQSGLLWGVISVLLLWVALQSLAATLGVDLPWWERLLGLWAVVGFHPVLLSVKMGQTAALLGAGLTFALAGLVADDGVGRTASGVLTALVGTFKFAYAPVGAHLLADRDRLVAAVVTGLVLVVGSVVLFGVDTNLAYLDVLAWGFAHGSGDRLPRAYLWTPPYFRQLHWLPYATGVRLVVAGAVAVAAALAREAGRAVFALGVAAFLLLTPLPYAYYFVAALPALVALLAEELERGADGHPIVPVLVLLALQVHVFGLRLLVGTLPPLFGGLPDLVFPLLQPGLWGVLACFGLAAVRVGAALPPVARQSVRF
jgi:alpha-1,2-mannosyltransferase